MVEELQNLIQKSDQLDVEAKYQEEFDLLKKFPVRINRQIFK